jgi:hypothetical protein
VRKTAGVVIASGRQRYHKLLHNPGEFWEMYYGRKKDNPKIMRYLPYTDHYEKLSAQYYVREATKLSKKYWEVSKDDSMQPNAQNMAVSLSNALDDFHQNMRGTGDFKEKEMLEIAENLSDEVDPHRVKDLVRDQKLYLERCYNQTS